MKTRATRQTLRAIVQNDYAGSQADFARQCGVDVADASRVLSGARPATLGFVRRVAGVLSPQAASELIAAFLSDVLSGVTDAFAGSITIRPKCTKESDGADTRSSTDGD